MKHEKFSKPQFSHKQNADYHRQRAAIVYEYIQYLQAHKFEQPQFSEPFQYSQLELVGALYDVLFAANKQIAYRDYLQHKRAQETQTYQPTI